MVEIIADQQRQTPEQKPGKIWIIPLVVIISVVFTGSLVYWWQNLTLQRIQIENQKLKEQINSLEGQIKQGKEETSKIPEVGPEPTSSPTGALRKIDILSTVGWKTVYQNGVSFKIPSEARCKSSTLSGEEDEKNCMYIYFSPDQIIPQGISVSEYKGGSRRDQFFGDYYEDCHWIYEEALFGNVKALQIASDVSWCQGGGGGIVAVIGDKFVNFSYLSYNPETKVIDRYPLRDTVISTFRKE